MSLRQPMAKLDEPAVITSTAPRTGTVTETTLRPTTAAEVDAVARAAEVAFGHVQEFSRERRAVLLETVAAALERHRDELVGTADNETALGETRLNGELSRSIYQLGLFAEAVRDGGYLEAAVDHAASTPLGPGPDVRRMLVPIGPVAVFGASNFPFAFSVLGGDTASALAVGCPVVLKAHESHPLTSERSFAALREGVADAGGPDGAVGIVYGRQAGLTLVQHPAIRGVGLTGSPAAAQALRDAIETRDEPIPFFGELSSLNPVLVTPAAAAARSRDIADGLYASVTGSGGQLCTKPGIALVPEGADGDDIVNGLADRASAAEPAILLNARIRDSFQDIAERLVDAGASPRATGAAPEGSAAIAVAPTVLEVPADRFTSGLAEEAFGPLVVIVRYAARDEALQVLSQLPGSLTATVQGEPDEDGLDEVFAALGRRAGRLIFNGYPTGVRVSWAQHHGGPWPATDTQHTSVGVTAVRRWLRPVAWQDVPDALLPEELRDGPDLVPRRVDGQLRLPSGH